MLLYHFHLNFDRTIFKATFSGNFWVFEGKIVVGAPNECKFSGSTLGYFGLISEKKLGQFGDNLRPNLSQNLAKFRPLCTFQMFL